MDGLSRMPPPAPINQKPGAWWDILERPTTISRHGVREFPVFAARLRQVWTSIAGRGRKVLRLPQNSGSPRDIEALALDLASERGEAINMATANAIVQRYVSLAKEQRDLFHLFLAQNFLPDPTRLKAAAEAYLAVPSPDAVAELTLASEPPRREL